MIDLNAIFSGYYNWLSDDPIAKARALPRLEVCASCEHLVKGGIWKARCGKCGCPIQAKARSRIRTCPLNKWPK